MANREAGLSADQVGLLTASIDYLDTDERTVRREVATTCVDSVTTDSGIMLDYADFRGGYAQASGIDGILSLILQEDDIRGREVTTTINYMIGHDGVWMQVVEGFDTPTGYAEKTVAISQQDEVARKFGKLLNRVF